MEPKEINKIFSEFLRQSMERNKLNQSELARRTGVSQERISRIVNNESRISLHDFVILCSALDTDIIKDLLSKMGKIGYIMLTLGEKNLYSPTATVHNMQYLPCGPYRDSFHFPYLLFRDPSAFQNWPSFKPISARLPLGSIPDLRQSVGIGTAATLSKNCNTNCHFVQIQRELAQNHCAEGLC